MKKELTQIKHARSTKDFPDIDLDKDEFVVLCIERTQAGLALIWGTVALLCLALTVSLIFISANFNPSNTFLVINDASRKYLILAILMLYATILFGGFISHSIYKQNKLYITNHCAIQKIRTSLFANSTNIIKLDRIEDVSYHQDNLFETIFQIGTLRMSTVGDETTYTFPWLGTPRDEVKTISELINRLGKDNEGKKKSD